MLEMCSDLIKISILLGLVVGFIFGGLVGLVLLGGWAWDKIEKLWK